MATPGFGFSVGDFVSGLTLVRKLIRALNDTAGSRASYRQLISELLDLDEALNQAKDLQVNPAQAGRKVFLQQIAGKCQLSIETFLNKNAKFKESLGPQPSASAWKSNLNKIQWALCKDGAIDELRTQITAHTTTLNLILATMQLSATRFQEESLSGCRQLLQSVEDEVKDSHALAKRNHQLLTTQSDLVMMLSNTLAGLSTGTQTNELQLLIQKVLESNLIIFSTVMQIQQLHSTIPPQVERQQPVFFEDAHGRHLPFHIEFINSFSVFQSVLEARFEDVPGLRKVKGLEYAMRDIASKKAIDLSRPWESVFRPGRRILMSMVFQLPKTSTSSCPGCLSENPSSPNSGEPDTQCSYCGIWYRRVTEVDIVRRGKKSSRGSRQTPAKRKKTSQGSPRSRKGSVESDVDEDEEDEVRDFRRVEIVQKEVPGYDMWYITPGTYQKPPSMSFTPAPERQLQIAREDQMRGAYAAQELRARMANRGVADMEIFIDRMAARPLRTVNLEDGPQLWGDEMSLRHLFGMEGAGKRTGEADGTGAKKRSAYDINDTFDDEDAVDASRDVKRRQQARPESKWLPRASPKYTRPSHRPAGGFQAARRRPHLSTGVSDPSASRSQSQSPQRRPPRGAALAASAPGVPGGLQAASASPWGRFRAPSKSPRKPQNLLNGLASSTNYFSNSLSTPPHVDRLPLTAGGLPRKTSSSVKSLFKPADRITGVLDDESSSGDDDEFSDSSDDDGDGTRGGRYPMDTRVSKDDEGIEPFDSSDESSEDSESGVHDSSKDDNDGDGVNPLRGLSAEKTDRPAQFSFEEIPKTPSGKPYNMFKNEHGVLERVNGALFPDGYQLQHLASFPEYRFICPVRDCRKLFTERLRLVNHSNSAHAKRHFNDNLDGTLSVKRRVDSGKSMVVSQGRLANNAPPPADPSVPSVQKRPDRRKPARIDTFEDIQDTNDGEYSPTDLTEPRNRAPLNRHQSERSTLTGPSVSGSADARAVQSPGNTPLEPFAVDPADIKSDVWTYIKPFVAKRWLALFQSEHERSAFLQAITLPRRNKVDKAWLEGTHNSHQKIFRALISIVIHVVGVRATCNGCEKRRTERKRNCMVLPPEAKDMRELQEIVGRQCVNCFFFPSSQRCEFATAGISVDTSNGVKKTPIPVPTPPSTLATMLASRPSPYTAIGLSRPTLSQPISKSPIPAPVLPLRPQASQPQGSQARFPAEESDGGPIRRPGLRSARELAAEADSHGDSVEDHGGLNSGRAYSADVTSNDEPASAAATPVASSSVSGAPPVASVVVSKAFTLFGEITQLPALEQSKVYEKMAAMLEMASRSPTTTEPAAPGQNQSNASHQSQVAAADGWEIAPGRLSFGGEPVAYSTSSLRRGAVSLNSAQYIAPMEKVLNKHITALDHLRIKREADWECKFSVTKGLVKVKMGDVEARIGYGGVWLVKHECIVTNVLHDESHIQVWWKHVDE